MSWKAFVFFVSLSKILTCLSSVSSIYGRWWPAFGSIDEAKKPRIATIKSKMYGTGGSKLAKVGASTPKPTAIVLVMS